MVEVAAPVDHRDGGLARQLDDLVVGEGADQDGVDVPAQNPRGVAHALSAPHLGVTVGDHQGVPPQLGHTHLGADPGPGRALAKDHREAPAPEGAVRRRTGLEAPGEFQQMAEVVAVVPGEVDEVACPIGSHAALAGQRM